MQFKLTLVSHSPSMWHQYYNIAYIWKHKSSSRFIVNYFNTIIFLIFFFFLKPALLWLALKHFLKPLMCVNWISSMCCWRSVFVSISSVFLIVLSHTGHAQPCHSVNNKSNQESFYGNRSMTCARRYSRDTGFWKEWQNLPTIKGLFTLFLSLRALRPVITNPRHTLTHQLCSLKEKIQKNGQSLTERKQEREIKVFIKKASFNIPVLSS